MNETPEFLKIPTKLAEELLTFLATKPISEALSLWDRVRKLQPCSEEAQTT